MPPERALNPRPEPTRRTSCVSLQGRELTAAPVDWDHAREFERAELCVEWVDGVPVSVPRYRIGDELRGNLL